MSDLLRHPDDVLSALLDGELTEAEAAEVHAHVVACAECSAELDAVRSARAAVRALPAVEPPPGFLERVLAAGREPQVEHPVPATVLGFRSRRAAIGNAAAAVAAGLLLVVGFGGNQASAVSAEVGGAVEQHSASLSAVSLGGGGVAAPTAVPAPRPRVPKPYAAPAELAGYHLVGVLPGTRGVHLLYRKGPYALSVFEQRGDIDLDDLPEEGTRLEVAGSDAWRWESGVAAGRVLVLDRGDLAVILVGDESSEAVLAAAEALPGPRRPSWPTRLKQATGDALDMLSPAG